MLFNSYGFILVYLPLVLGGFFLLGRRSPWLATAFLALASLVFYGWWDVTYLPLLLGSIAFNFFVGRQVLRRREVDRPSARVWVTAGVATNLLLLGYYKYADFFVSNINVALGTSLVQPGIVLPIGISFFTFTQIAYLVDAYQGKASEYEPVQYGLFVTYFPHLVAGPILHHREMMPQFRDRAIFTPVAEHVSVGVSIFVIGLFKKVVIADGIAEYATPGFAAAAEGKSLTMSEAWFAALSYTMQLYFDFSGYSDMAVGLSRMFGVRLPLNFDSPYKASSIIEFWRRWHMTLSRFLKDYLYVPLGGSRRGPLRRHLNLFITMVLGGMWHGASWTFIVWGALHGAYLVANHAWRVIRGGGPMVFGERAAYATLTFVAVVLAWVFFRAESVGTALEMVKAMMGWNGFGLPEAINARLSALPGVPKEWLVAPSGTGIDLRSNFLWICACAFIAWVLPNTQQMMGRHVMGEGHVATGLLARFPALAWRPNAFWLATVVALGLISMSRLNRVSEFLYFQF